MFARRELIKLGLASGAAAGLASLPNLGLAATAPRAIALQNTHTGEKLSCCYYENGKYVPTAVAALNKILRDHRSGDVHMMDPGLYDILTAIQAKTGGRGAFQIISGYRSPATNNKLHAKSSGVAKKSLHMEGKAMDIRLPGVELANVRKAALTLQKGGVGFYPTSNFVHVDTGRVRQWQGV